MLSKESMKGLDVVSVTTDLLYAMEKLEQGTKRLETPEEKRTFERGLKLLNRLASVADAQIANSRMPDLFLLRIVTALEKDLRIRPSQLKQVLEQAQREIENASPSPETKTLVEKVSELTMKSTNKSVAALSNPLQ